MDRNVELQTIEIAIPAGRTLRIRGGAACRVSVAAGRTWVAEEGRADDTILAAGDHERLRHEGLALVYAFAPSRVAVECAASGAVPEMRIGGGHREVSWLIFRTLIGTAVRRAMAALVNRPEARGLRRPA